MKLFGTYPPEAIQLKIKLNNKKIRGCFDVRFILLGCGSITLKSNQFIPLFQVQLYAFLPFAWPQEAIFLYQVLFQCLKCLQGSTDKLIHFQIQHIILELNRER